MRHEDEQDAGEGLTGYPTAFLDHAQLPSWPIGFGVAAAPGQADRTRGRVGVGAPGVARRGIRVGGGSSGIGCLTGPGGETAREHRTPGGRRSHGRRSRMGPPCAAPGVGAAAPLERLLTVGGRGVVTTARVRGGAAAGAGPFVRPTVGPGRAGRAAPGLHRGPPPPSPAWIDAGCCSQWVRARSACWRVADSPTVHRGTTAPGPNGGTAGAGPPGTPVLRRAGPAPTRIAPPDTVACWVPGTPPLVALTVDDGPSGAAAAADRQRPDPDREPHLGPPLTSAP